MIDNYKLLIMIKNISICMLLFISVLSFGQTRCDTLHQSFILTEKPPKTELSFDEIENYLLKFRSKINC